MPGRIRANARLKGGLVGLLAGLFAIAVAAPAASAAVIPVTNDSAGASALGSEMLAQPIGTGASFATIPGTGTPHAFIDAPLSSFPTNGGTAALLTTGDAQLADDANLATSSGANLGGGAVRGDSDRDVTVLKVDLAVPAGTNCLTFDFQFYSEEYPEFVGGSVNDAFVAELDVSSWTTTGGVISAPNNFAFDPSGNPISINATGPTAMSAAAAAGTTYDGATQLLQASTQVTPGPHSLYLSIFDQGDNIYDSATLIDRLHARFTPQPDVDCVAGAQPPPPPPPPLEPIEGQQVVATPEGVVEARCPGQGDFGPLTTTQEIPIGCIIDASNGRVTIASLYNGIPETVTLYDGRFKLKQKEGAKPFLTAELNGPLGCPGRSSKAKASDAGDLRSKGRRNRRRLWADGKGHYRTEGDGGSGSRRSTKFFAADRCGRETFFRVRKGKVVIDDFDIPGKKNRVLKAGKTYLTKD